MTLPDLCQRHGVLALYLFGSRADRHELDVMRRAADLVPIERWIEHETFGVATT